MPTYNPSGQINLTVVGGTVPVGHYAADGSWNIVVNAGTGGPIGLYHPSGAYNAVVVTDPGSPYYSANGSMNVIANAASPSGFSPVQPRAIGVVAAPFVPLSGSAFDVNFATSQASGATLSNFTCARAQTVPSYVRNADGTWTQCAANALRIGTGTGLLIEESRKNLLLNSEDLTAGVWATSLTGSGTISVGSATTTNLTAGIGGNLITVNRSVNTDQAEVYQTFTGTSAIYSGGFFVKAATTADIGKHIYVSFFDGGSTTAVIIILTGDIQRVPVLTTLNAAPNCNLGLGYIGGFGLGTGSVSFYAGGAQAELGGGLTSYIPNTAAIQNTRNADVITTNGIVTTTYQSAAATQFVRLFNAIGSSSSARLGMSQGSSIGGFTPAFMGSATTIASYNGGVQSGATIGGGVNFGDTGSNQFATNTNGGPVNSVSSWSASLISNVANNGVEVTTATSYTAAAPFNIGSDAGQASFLNGHIMRLAGWNTQLAAGTRAALSQTYTTSSQVIGGVNTTYFVPANIPLSGTFVMYHHGAGETETAWTSDVLKIALRETLLAQGHILSASAAAGDNWGNNASLAAYTAQWADVQTRYSPSKLVFLSQSMGGETGLLTIAAATMPVKGWYGIYPACNLAVEYGLSFTAAINTAYNIPGGGTYAAQTAGHDPVLLSSSKFPLRMRFIASTADAVVPGTTNSGQMKTLVSPVAIESAWLQSIGTHGDSTNFIPSDVVSFIARC